MLTWVLITLFLGLILWIGRKPGSLPPGRWGLPLIGYIPLYDQNFTTILNDFKKEYGDIFTWKIGSRVMVGLCNYKMIKTTFSRPECQGRPDLYTNKIFMFHENSGIITSVGTVWSEGRRFALRHLKDFGMGKSSMDEVIQYEAIALANSYEDTAGTPVELSWNLNVAVLNVIWKLVADIRYEPNDEAIMNLSATIDSNVRSTQGLMVLLNLYPNIEKYIPKVILNRCLKHDVVFQKQKILIDFFKDVVEDHVKTFDANNHRGYIDAYLAEIQNQKGNTDAIFKDDYNNLVTTISDLFLAGSETTSSTTRWLVCLLAIHTDIQEKMQKEIDEVVPRDTAPSLEDRPKLPYTEAVLLEAQRYASLAPIGVFHSTTEDIQLGDYHLPKDTVLFGCSEMCHQNPEYWERPDDFYPEHFLDDQGKLLTKKEGFLPFSIGRRQCLGESLAKMELFLFATCLFQKFFIIPPKGTVLTAEADINQPFLHFVKPYKVVLTKRE